MTHLGLFIAGIALATGAFAQGAKPQGGRGAAGTAALQGTWLISSINGQTAPEGSPELKLTFEGDKYHQTLGGTVNERGTFKVDASKKPITIDLSIAEGSDAGKTQLGIFEVTGDTMRLSLDTPGAGQRPPDFSPKDGLLVVAAKKSK
jgi:uncharacterized protein (TIGR03067 family)